ncbi:MAG TPA: tRNA pseudouridine(55) synthase TruB [Candidatus Paceibacterota bacterium]|nr:tRNA pseudouridine(55) synthase TruB [Candidatus Paceibacterota bacterium]
MDGEILLVDKPKGITSFDVIRRLRRKLGIRKMGHAGTLDPLASGLMLIGVGKGTKRLASLLKLPKTYEAEIILGERRSTGDLEGEVLETVPVPDLAEAAVQEALSSLVGTQELPVPKYSAIKQDGVPLYKKARRGEDVATPVRAMEVREAELLGMQHERDRLRVTVRFAVGSGTYIRSLAEAFGQKLGYPATLGGLRRTSVGDYHVEDANIDLDTKCANI